MTLLLSEDGWERYLGSRLQRAQVDLTDHMEDIQQQLDTKFRCMELEFHAKFDNAFFRLSTMAKPTRKVMAERQQVKSKVLPYYHIPYYLLMYLLVYLLYTTTTATTTTTTITTSTNNNNNRSIHFVCASLNK